MEGVRGRWYTTDRREKVDWLLYQALAQGVVKIEGPPSTGKTSLMQILCDRARETGWGRVLECSAAECGSEATINNVLSQTTAAKGDDWGTIFGQLLPDTSGGARYEVHLSKMTLVCIDEAQVMFESAYSNASFWGNLRRLQQTGGRSRSVRVVLFVVYGDGPSGIPQRYQASGPFMAENVVKFRASASDSDSDIGTRELALDRAEYRQLWERFITRGGYSNLFQDPELQEQLLEMTSGHVGLITAFMDKLHGKLSGIAPTDAPVNKGIGDELIRYMLRTGQASDCVKSLRGVVCNMEQLDKLSPMLSAVWAAGADGCHEGAIISAWVQRKMDSSGSSSDTTGSSSHNIDALCRTAERLLRDLHHGGHLLLLDPDSGRYYFASPLHYTYYLMQMSCRRYQPLRLSIGEDFPLFLHHSVSHMSASALLHSYNRRGLDSQRVYERRYQVEWYRAAAALVPDDVKILPAVGTVFSSQGYVDFWVQPGASHSLTMSTDTEPTDYQLPQGWAVELLVHGDMLDKKHITPIAPGAVYAHLPCAQHAIIDFWTEEPKANIVDLVSKSDAYYVVHFGPKFKTAKFLMPGGKEVALQLS